jgi:serine/threonine protein kinase
MLKGAHIGKLKTSFFDSNEKDTFRENIRKFCIELNIYTKNNFIFSAASENLKKIYFYQIILENGGSPVNKVNKIYSYKSILIAIKNLVEGIIKLNNFTEKGVESGIIHHDIKSANILLKDLEDGTPKLNMIDFGMSIPITDAYKLKDIFANDYAEYIYLPSEYYLLRLILTNLYEEKYKEKTSYTINDVSNVLHYDAKELLQHLEDFRELITFDYKYLPPSNVVTDFYGVRFETFKSIHKVQVDTQVFYSNLRSFVNDMITNLEIKIPTTSTSAKIASFVRSARSAKSSQSSQSSRTNRFTVGQFLYTGKDAYFGVNAVKKLDIYSMGYIIIDLKKIINPYELTDHTFINGIIQQCLTPDLNNRISGEELKQKLDNKINSITGGKIKSKKSRGSNSNKKMDRLFDYDKWINN